MKQRQFIIHLLIAIGLFLLFAALRWYHLDKRIIFDWDQEQFSNQIKDIVVSHKLTLLGPRVVSDKGFFLAPYFTYILVPFYLLTRLHPMAMLYFILCMNALFFFASFFILRKLFSAHAALAFLFMWTINPLLVMYDTIPWWPVTIPTGIIATWYALRQIYDKNRYRDWVLLALILGLFMNMHFQFIFLILFSGIFTLFLIFQKKASLGKCIVACSVFASLCLHLFFFDLSHGLLHTHL